jgi:diguanylate cyclase (GGDEF)-like protein
LPPFLIPIVAFFLWLLAIVFYLPVFKLGLNLSNQLIASQFFLSFLILVFAWTLSGPVTAAVLSLVAAFMALYLVLGAREPAIFLQIIIYAVFFVLVVSILHRIQNKTNNQILRREKLEEDIHLTQEAVEARDSLRAALEEKIRRFLGLRGFSKELRVQSDLEPAALKIVDEIQRTLTGAETCVLYLVDPAEQKLSLTAALARDGAAIKEKQGSIFDEWVMKRSQAILVEDAQSDFRFSREATEAFSHLRSVCASPLVIENKVLGVLRVGSAKPRAFETDDLRLLDIFSSLAAVTLKNILLYRQTRELAIRDSLTGLYLNRYFQEKLAYEIQRSNFDEINFSLILIDIDFFKRYNDEYGHAAGDLVLKNVTALILKCVKPVDFVARYGGEEFAIILPDKKKKEAAAIAERIRLSIEKNKFFVRRTQAHVTVSLGVAAFPEGGRTREELLWTADKNLYEAKHQGRNRVCGNI